MQTWYIHIEGQVQGVGFRPHVWQLAQELQLKGWVKNANDGVHIVFNGTAAQAQTFYNRLHQAPPLLAHIIRHQMQGLPDVQNFEDFRIVESDSNDKPRLMITPDFGICESCRAELHTPGNRRENYPFTTCTKCGPRFSLIRSLPYDRERTTMAPFSMCKACQQEYNTPTNGRFYSQTNSCPQCGINLRLINHNGSEVNIESGDILPLIQAAWNAGQIVAVKGIGGFLLTCNATDVPTVKALRRRKKRPRKPLAVMFPNAALARQHVVLSDQELTLLNGPVAPILLARLTGQGTASLPINLLAPKLNRLGVMLPYTPLFELLLSGFGKPIVATSGNSSGSPIIYQEQEALAEVTHIADWILSDDREIVLPQDDSVVQCSTLHPRPIIIRRSRGLAPSIMVDSFNLGDQTIIATGAQLKSTFGIWQNEQCYISPYLGDQGAYLSQQLYRSSMAHMQELLHAKPSAILSDRHLDYTPSILGSEMAQDQQIKQYFFQHHEAHFGAVLAENSLLDVSSPCLGVIWDGTGLGKDGQIWGGEFFSYSNYEFTRTMHWAYQPHLAGDKMAKEPRLSALSFCHQHPSAQSRLQGKFSEAEWRIYQQSMKRPRQLRTSSIGRLFDAVACLLDIADQQTYEGEAAMQLEALASSYINQHGIPDTVIYGVLVKDRSTPIPTHTLMESLVEDLTQGTDYGLIAARFHYSLVQHLKAVADTLAIKQLAFSGGTFQNALLVDLIQELLPQPYQLFFHQQLSPNDENISFGQMACYYAQQQAAAQQNKRNHVFSNTRKN